ncbi:PilZ domain-containing protein [Novosphingobium album (ex Liu et al. 2023)]|uniref:PilZ domain-containing protein n=1 Tax=Novosphingobium album (ex Liu et al. 2023) TaxID=3031130 RepID=A0ABT5WVA7_9SPHN|nr:PilZ domain-containing protein [Novosphingobium album (ex Liu et al. 2023)]MDE8653796.1 PilZ domain-containing protein [Novosphingobium album (ex Liu et al. 2023)]
MTQDRDKIDDAADQAQASDAQHDRDQRVAPRFALLLRGAKLLCTRGEFLCIIRDVSETGVKLRLFHPLPTGEQHFLLEQSCGDRFMAELVWERDGEAGFRFASAIDVAHFLAEENLYPRRPIRLNVASPVMLTVERRLVPATLCNISREGARIETAERLAIGQPLRIAGADLPEFDATVCWRKAPAHGLAFRQCMDLGDLARLVATMNLHDGNDKPPHVNVA